MTIIRLRSFCGMATRYLAANMSKLAQLHNLFLTGLKYMTQTVHTDAYMNIILCFQKILRD